MSDKSITFGKYKKPLVWDVIDETDDAQLLLCRDIVEYRMFDPKSNDWEMSDIRSWLNNYCLNIHTGDDYSNIGFLNAFTEIELNRLRDYYYVDRDAIFLLSKDEYEAHKGNIKSISGYWWLRSPGSSTYCAADVVKDGSVMDNLYYVYAILGVRPTLWLNKE